MRKLFLSVLSGLLLAFAWPEIGVFPLIFIGFIPLLILEEDISKSEEKMSWKVFGYSFITFFIFNIITTYWVWHASTGGAFAAFVINALLMSVAFVLFHKVKRVLASKRIYFALLFFWISLEYLHLHWELAWPWLTLGNVFATVPKIVQWYEYTGVLGGSLWILTINILLFRWWNSERIKKQLIFPFTILLMPIIISFLITVEYDKEKMIEVVIVQPNIFNKEEKTFDIDRFISLSESKITSSTELLLAPETVLQGTRNENNVMKYSDIDKLLKLQEKYPKLNILIGAATIKKNNIYNSAIFMSKDKNLFYHHKTKLVPGAEAIPYPSLFNRFKDLLSIKLDGVAGNYDREKDITIFSIDKVDILPLICYESVFGELLRRKKSNIIAIITNDGWWKNTAGFKQHFQYARLRAIEQRRSIIRSANTGISGLIDPNGEVIEQTNWKEEIAINVKVPLNESVTFYNKFGDYIGRLSGFLAAMLFIVAFVKGRLKK